MDQPKETAMTATERARVEQRNIGTLTEIWSALNHGDVEPFSRNISDDFVWKGDAYMPFPGEAVGRLAGLKMMEMSYVIYPGITFEPLVVSASYNNVTFIFIMRANGVNGFMGLPNIHHPIEVHFCVFNTFDEQGKLKENWFFYDRGYILQQVGQVPNVSFAGLPPQCEWPPWYHSDSSEILPCGSCHTRSLPERAVTSSGLTDLILEVTRLPIQTMLRCLQILGRDRIREGAHREAAVPSRGHEFRSLR